jgi:hypothetical protein
MFDADGAAPMVEVENPACLGVPNAGDVRARSNVGIMRTRRERVNAGSEP